MISGAAGNDSPEAAATSGAAASARILHRLGTPHDAAGNPRRPDAATLPRVLGDPVHAQQADHVLCAWAVALARDLRPGMRRHLRVDGKALRGAARDGSAPMLVSGLGDDGTTAAQFPVHPKKENEIPKKIARAGAFFLSTIGDNQQKLFDAADALPWRTITDEAWTVDRGHGRIDVRTIKTLPSAGLIAAKWPEARQGLPWGELLVRLGVRGQGLLPASRAAAPAAASKSAVSRQCTAAPRRRGRPMNPFQATGVA